MKLAILLLGALLAVQGQFIKQNSWKIRSKQQGCELDLKRIFGENQGAALIFEGTNLLSILLLHPYSHQYEYITGGRSVLINIDFGQTNPKNFGKVESKFNISVATAGKEWHGMRSISYFGSHAVLRLKGCVVQISTEGAAYIWLILLNICLAGVTILLLTVVMKRKRWSQVEPMFLMVLLGWQIKKILILWFECGHFFGNADNCNCVAITKYLLIILSIKSVKIAAEVFRISNYILKNWKATASMASAIIAAILILPMIILHLLIPISFLLQLRKYSRYSRLDFEVHYALINLNIFLILQFFYILLTRHSHLSLFTSILAAYSFCSTVAFFIIGELQQYSPENNRSSSCITVDFDNKRFCPHCLDQLYEEEDHDGSKSKECHDLSYDLWKLGVAQCGHIFHCNCLRSLLRLQQGCPLARQFDQTNSKHDIPNRFNQTIEMM